MKTTKEFDCVKMMRDIRDKVNAEIVDMNPAQILEYFQKKSVEFECKNSNAVKKPLAPQQF